MKRDQCILAVSAIVLPFSRRMAPAIVRTLLGLAPVALLLDIGQAKAESVKLADLLVAGSSLVEGDKTFFNFQNYSSDVSGGASSVDPADIMVTSGTFGGEIGLVFQSPNFLADQLQVQETKFTYDVSASGALITDGSLGFSHSDTTAVDTGASIVEMVTNIAPDLQVNYFAGGGNDMDHRDLDTPLVSVHVSTDLVVMGGNGRISVSQFQETFSQMVVPEPATFNVLGMGAGIVGLAWRRRKRAAAKSSTPLCAVARSYDQHASQGHAPSASHSAENRRGEEI
jgi:hypothetical protein